MTDLTLVNGSDAKEGSAQIGKLTEKPDVPVEFYQYEPVSETTDPGFSAVINPDDMSDAELCVRKLSDMQRIITTQGLNYETVVALESIVPGIIMGCYPESGYSNELSQQSLHVTLERIDIAKVTGVLAIISAVIALIYSLLGRVVEGNADASVPPAAQIEDARRKESTKVKEIEQNVRDMERIAKRKSDAVQWLVNHRIVDCMRLHKRLNPSLNIDAAAENPIQYIEQLSRVKNLFNLDGILSTNMPALFYMNTSQLKATLTKYMRFLDNVDEALRDRVDNIGKMIQYYHDLKRNPNATFTISNAKLLKLLGDFTGKTYTDEQVAIAEFSAIITQHWEIPQNPKVKPEMASSLISNEFTNSFTRLVDAATPLEKLAKHNQFLAKDFDIRRQFKYLDIATKEINDALASDRLSEEQRSAFMTSLRKLEQAPNQFQSEYRIVRSHMVSIIRPVANAGRAARAMRSNVMGYNRLVDDLYELLEKFNANFGEEK